METAILDTLLNSIATVCIGSSGTLMGHAKSLFGILISIDFILAIIFSLLQFGSGPNYIALTIKKILTYGFWIWVITNWGSFCTIVIESLGQAGVDVGGGSIAVLTHPSSIVDSGIARTSELWNFINNMNSMDLVLGKFGIAITSVIVAIATVVAYAIIAFQVFITYVEFYITSALMLIFIPFATTKYTERFAQNCIGGVIAQGTKIMFLGALIGISVPLLDSLTVKFNSTPTWNDLVAIGLAPWAIAYLSWQAPAIASGFMSGGPALSAGSVTSSVASGIGGFMGAKAGVSGVIGAAARGGASLAGAATGGITGHSGNKAIGFAKGMGNFVTNAALGSSIDSFKHSRNVASENPFTRRQVNADGSSKRTSEGKQDSNKYDDNKSDT